MPKLVMALVVSTLLHLVLSVSSDARQDEKRLARQKVDALNRELAERGARWRAGDVSRYYPTREESERMFPPIPRISDEVLRTLPMIRAASTDTFPSSWDWRAMNGVTPVKDQNSPRGCGSCYIFAAVAQLESFIRIYDGRQEDLSEQQALSCHNPVQRGSLCIGGCCGGSADRPYNVFMDPGAASDTCMVYQADDGVACGEHECAVHGRISGYSVVSNDDNSLKLALQSGPVWVDMYSNDDFKFFYDGGCFTWDSTSSVQSPNHALLCVGWDDDLCDGLGAWIVKNSWDTAWGDQGYGYIRYGTRTFAADAFQIHYVSGPVTRLYVSEPAGIRIWAVGSEHRIGWCSIGLAVDHFEVGYYSASIYHVIDANVDAGVRQLTWTLPDNPSESCTIEVAAHDASDSLIGCGRSEGSFEIAVARAQWSVGGVTACDASGAQENPVVAPDDAGGVIVAWKDARNGYSVVYAQRLSGDGDALWPGGGVPVSRFPAPFGLRIAPNGAGGVIVVWEDPRGLDSQRGYDIYAQDIGEDGKVLASDIPVCAREGDQLQPQAASSDFGGAIVTWMDERGSDSDIYAQRITSGGYLAWQPNGVPVCTAAGIQRTPRVVSDGLGGAIIVWSDARAGNYDIYAQRLSAGGTAAWQLNGVPVCVTPGNQLLAGLVSGGIGSAIAIWTFDGDGTASDIYAQKILVDGALSWTPDGLALCTAPEKQVSPRMVSDGAGGAIVAWQDYRGEWLGQIPFVNRQDLGREDIYAQRVGADGAVLWSANGVPVCVMPRSQAEPQIAHDGTGGAIIIWRDNRDSRWMNVGEGEIQADEMNYDIFGARIDAQGRALWRDNGEPICADPSEQRTAVLTADHHGYVYVAWADSRNGDSDVFVQKLAGRFSGSPGIAYGYFDVSEGRSLNRGFMNGCPQGDQELVRAVISFNASDLIGEIDKTRIVLAKSDSIITFWSNGVICADSSVSPDHVSLGRARTTITHASFSRNWALDDHAMMGTDVGIYLDGEYIGGMKMLTVKSPDYTGDGIVNSGDMFYFNETYGKWGGEEGYNPWFDFNGDNYVNALDALKMGLHMNHVKPGGCESLPYDSAETVLQLTARKNHKLDRIELSLRLEKANGIATACFGLGFDRRAYVYVGYYAASRDSVSLFVGGVSRDGSDMLFVSAHDMKPGADGGIDLGRIVLHPVGGMERSPTDSDFVFRFGDVRNADGKILYLRAGGFEALPPAPGSVINDLSDAYPNPFNPMTTIRYSIAEDTPVNLSIYNVNGQLVRTLVSTTQKGDAYTAMWDGRDNRGRPAQSGVYFYRIKTNGFTKSKKLVLLR